MAIGAMRSHIGIVLFVACAMAAVAAPADAAPAKCAGKKATIVSNAPRIAGTPGHDVILAGGSDNVVFGGGGNDVICGGGGNDTLYGERGNDALRGGDGDDTLYGGRGSDDLDGGLGKDRLIGETGNDTLSGGPGDGDNLDGGVGDDTLSGGAGDLDVLHGGPGNDRLDGGPGGHDIASYKGAGGPVTVDLGRGVVSGAEGERLGEVEDVLGGSGDDVLTGSAAPNRLDGGPGDDRLFAVGDGDEAFGGPGDDACSGRFASETACGNSGGSGHGTAVALISSITGATALIVTGSDGSDNVTVSAVGEGYMLQGGGELEVLLGEPEPAVCVRDRGANSVFCRGRVGSIQAALGAGDDTFAIADGFPSGISATVDGGAGNDTLRGGPADDTLYGGDDRDPDTLEGGGGDDALFGVNIFHPRHGGGAARMVGGGGDDLLIGGQPCNGDLFDGGPGNNDSASFARIRNSGINVKATIGGAVLDPGVPGCNAGHISSSVEKIEGSPGADILIGDGGANTLLGRGGDDVLDGRGGFDRCIQGAGSGRRSNCEFASWRTPLRKRIP